MTETAPNAHLVPLCNANLDRLPAHVLRPRYDRSSLSPGIVHIGVGNFHRAHQAWYLHRLMQEGAAHDWAILGAGVRSYDRDMREKLLRQDCLTTLLELDPRGSSAEVVGAMIDYLPVEDGHPSLVAAMTHPSTRIVSLTVTEGGYFTDVATGQLDTAHPDIVHDATHPDRPVTAFGAMILALRHRRDGGHPPFTGMSCDNLRHNGSVLRQTLVTLAEMSDPDLASWISGEGAFPSSMVDCIVPATGPDEIEQVRQLGIDDTCPVTHENFRQWVIEDDFCVGRPNWDEAGATFSGRVEDYETMKIRILNAGHQVLANVGEICGVATIADCMRHEKIAAFFDKVQRDEIVPHVPSVPGTDALAYLEQIKTRFANPQIRDTTRRVAYDGTSRHAGFVLPILNDGIASGTPIDGLILTEALWARMCAGHRENGSVIEANDPHWSMLQDTALKARHDPRIWIAQPQIYGELANADAISDRFAFWLTHVWDHGAVASLDAYLKS